MGRSRYKIYEPTHPHFVTCTILHWLPLFTRQESVAIIIDSIKFLQNKDNLKLYAYVILENHLHMLLSSDDLHKSMQSFKQYTAKQLLELLKKENATILLDQLAFYKKALKRFTFKSFSTSHAFAATNSSSHALASALKVHETYTHSHHLQTLHLHR